MREINEYIFQYLQDCDYQYDIYSLASSVELEFDISFKKALVIVKNELKQLGEV